LGDGNTTMTAIEEKGKEVQNASISEIYGLERAVV
jgi:hypothetical protein